MANDEKTNNEMDPKLWKELLGVISTELPGLIKSILSSVFSEEAGRNMGKAAAAYYKELKTGGLPDAVAIKLTEEYMRTFTSFGDMLRNAGKGGWGAEEWFKKKSQEKTQEEE